MTTEEEYQYTDEELEALKAAEEPGTSHGEITSPARAEVMRNTP